MVWVVGKEVYLLVPVLTVWVVIPFHQFALLPPKSRPLVKYHLVKCHTFHDGLQVLSQTGVRGQNRNHLEVRGFNHRHSANTHPSVPDLPSPLHSTSPGAHSIPPIL